MMETDLPSGPVYRTVEECKMAKATLAQPVLQTQRLILRPLAISDVPQLQQLANDFDIAEATLGVSFPYSLKDANTWITDSWDVYSERKGVAFAVVLRTDEEEDSADDSNDDGEVTEVTDHDSTDLGQVTDSDSRPVGHISGDDSKDKGEVIGDDSKDKGEVIDDDSKAEGEVTGDDPKEVRQITGDDSKEVRQLTGNDPTDAKDEGKVTDEESTDLGQVTESDPRDEGQVTGDDSKDVGQVIDNDPKEVGQVKKGQDVKAAGLMIGVVDLELHMDNNCAELGFFLGKKYWNRGYCTEACKSLLYYAFNELNLNCVYACHFKDNIASGKVLRKLGLKYEGCLRQRYKKERGYVDDVSYSILKTEFLSLLFNQEI